MLGGLGAYLYFSQQDESTVPGVTGLPQERAEAEVREAGLEPDTTRRESTRPQGIVIEQSPEAGSEVDEGSSVRLVVSTGPPRDTVPNLVGQTEAEAVDDGGKPVSNPRRRGCSRRGRRASLSRRSRRRARI